MIWQDMSHLNSKWKTAWLAGLGSTGMGQTVGTDWWALQNHINSALQSLGRLPILVTEEPDAATCGALSFLVAVVKSGQLPASEQTWIAIAQENLGAVEAMCAEQMLPEPQIDPNATTQPIQPAGPITQVSLDACTPQGCDCYVNEGDSGRHMAHFQSQLNAALDGAGYKKIPATGIYDAATCGAVFELGGAFQPTYPASCTNPELEWVVPLRCEDMVMPIKKSSRNTFGIFAIGAVAVGGVAYFVMRQRV